MQRRNMLSMRDIKLEIVDQSSIKRRLDSLVPDLVDSGETSEDGWRAPRYNLAAHVQGKAGIKQDSSVVFRFHD